MINFLKQASRNVRPKRAFPVLLVGLVLAGRGVYAAEDAVAMLAGIETASRFRNGLVVYLGCTDGALVCALAARPGVLAQGLTADAAAVGAIRDRISREGLARTASARTWAGDRLPYAANTVDVVVASVPLPVGQEELMRVLVPDGKACVRDNDGKWVVTRKPVPAELDEWSHFLHGPDNVPVSRDTAVGFPTGLQWVAGPLWARDHDSTPGVFGMVTAGGRLFYVLDEGPIGVVDKRLPDRHAVYARSAYNGVVLWRRPLPSWTPSYQWWGTIPEYLHRAMVADREHLYLTDGLNGEVIALDAGSGREVRRFAGTKGAAELIKTGSTLVVGTMDLTSGRVREYPSTRAQPLNRGGIKAHRRRGTKLAAFDVRAGEERWSVPSQFVPLTFCSDGSRLYVAETDAVRALDLQSGADLWRRPGAATKLMVQEGVLVACVERPRAKTKTKGKRRPRRRPSIVVRGHAAADGALLWEVSGESLPTFTHCFYIAPEVMIAKGLVWLTVDASTTGFDLRTGEFKRRISMKGAQTPGHHVRCYPAKATERFALFNKRGIEFLDWAGGDRAATKHDWLRGACRLGIIPSNGLLYTPPHGCNCYVEAIVRGMVAYHSRPAAAVEPGPDTGRLERGRAYGAAPESEEAAGSWPAFRHDPQRTSSTGARLAADLGPGWQHSFASRISPPVFAAERLVLAEVDARAVHCLDAATGEVRWSFSAGGRVDSPPALTRGLVVFGAADGCVYALRAGDGALVWRFRAAPQDTQTVAFGQLESLWPCHGSVLVENGLVYTAAGRSSYLDGGLTFYALELFSGQVKHRCRVHTERKQETSGRETLNTDGALNDILVSDGSHIYLRHLKFDRKLNLLSSQYPIDRENHSPRPRVMASSGFLDAAENKRTFRRCTTEWNGRYSPLRTQQLAADDVAVYGCRIHYGRGWKSPRYHLGDGTLVFAQDHAEAAKIPTEPTRSAAQRGLRNAWQFTIPKDSFRWQSRLPLYAKAVVLAGDTLFVAGRHDRSFEDLIKVMDGQAEGVLVRMSTADGTVQRTTSLPSPPVTDGLIVGGTKAFVVLRNNTVLCLQQRVL